jgi:hypothetical protein
MGDYDPYGDMGMNDMGMSDIDGENGNDDKGFEF